MNNIVWSIGITSDAEQLRYEVFTLEQGFKKEDDVDDIDRFADEIVIYEDGVAVATGRLFPEDDSNKQVENENTQKGFCFTSSCRKV